MCLTLTNAAAIIDHHLSPRPAGRGYPRTLNHISELTPGDLWRADVDEDPHTVTEVHHTRDRAIHLGHITLVDQYAHARAYRSDEVIPTAIPDPLIVPLTGKEPTR